MSEPRGEYDTGILQLIAAGFDPAMAALDGVDLADLPLEPDLDPSRAPRTGGADQ
jgi:hypothetical protein